MLCKNPGFKFRPVRLLMATTLLTLIAILVYNRMAYSFTSMLTIREFIIPTDSYSSHAAIVTSAINKEFSHRTIKSSKLIKPLPPLKHSKRNNLKSRNPPSTRIPPTTGPCRFATVDPFDSSSMLFFTKLSALNCTGDLPSFIYLQNDNLYFNKTKAKLRGVKIDYCNFTSLTLSKKRDNRHEELYKSQNFNDSISLTDDLEHLVIDCFFNKTRISESFVTRIKKKPKVEQERRESYKRHTETNRPKETLSILLVGMDGMSRQNFIRTMPKTRDFILNQMGALEVKKLNRIGYSTFPNLIGMLTGLSTEDLTNKIGYSSGKALDMIDDKMLWSHFKKAGYRTAMILDDRSITAFHYAKHGWDKPPWDYYQRPIVLKLAGRKNRHCIGEVPEVTFLLDYWLQMTSLYNNSKETPYFAFSFNQRLTHNSVQKATITEPLYHQWFEEIHKRNVLNNTLLVFFSDHGGRFGRFRSTIPGIIESRNPFLFFIFPKWFRAKYPLLMSVFQNNQNKLTTMYDVHETLKDFVNFQAAIGKGNLKSRGISLFKEIPSERLCTHAEIPTMFCLCQNFDGVKITQKVKNQAANALLESVNSKSKKRRKECQTFTLKNYQSDIKVRVDRKCVTCSYFNVTVTLTPGDVIFKGSVVRNDTSGKVKALNDLVTVKGLDEKLTSCIKDSKVKPYCYCPN